MLCRSLVNSHPTTSTSVLDSPSLGATPLRWITLLRHYSIAIDGKRTQVPFLKKIIRDAPSDTAYIAIGSPLVNIQPAPSIKAPLRSLTS